MPTKKYSLFLFLTLFSTTVFAQDTKLVYAADVIRHGARAPMQFRELE